MRKALNCRDPGIVSACGLEREESEARGPDNRLKVVGPSHEKFLGMMRSGGEKLPCKLSKTEDRAGHGAEKNQNRGEKSAPNHGRP